MNWEDYRTEVKDDAARELEDSWQDGWMNCIDTDARTIDETMLCDDLWAEDGVTGNGSGSYTFSRAAAIDNVKDVIWSEEFEDALDSWGWTFGELHEKGPEVIDVTIRCHVLSEVCHDVATEFASKHGFTIVD